MSWHGLWWFMSPILGGLAGATVLAYSKRYFEERAKVLATKHDLEEIQRQLRENTELTRTIEQAFSRADYLSRSELAFREKQLAEFYGPVYGVLQSQRRLYALWMEQRMTEVNLKVKQLFAEQNKFVRQLIIDKAHLIEGPTMPESFTRFTTSTLVFDMYAAGADAAIVPGHLASLEEVRFPTDFYDHVVTVTERIKQRLDALHEENAIKPQNLVRQNLPQVP